MNDMNDIDNVIDVNDVNNVNEIENMDKIENVDNMNVKKVKKERKRKEKHIHEKSHYCYILRNTYANHINRTYNGYTVNPGHRIRQHNQEIAGGAQYTKKWGNKSWEIYLLIKGFPDHQNALQCEWKIKHPARKRIRPPKYNGPSGRITGLNEILKLQKWTSKSIHDTKDLNLEIWVQRDYETLLTDIPENIKINVVDKIDLTSV